MDQYISLEQRLPKMVVAVAAAVAAVYAPNIWLRGLLAGLAATASATVVFGPGGISPTAQRQNDSQPQWRTLKTYRVEA